MLHRGSAARRAVRPATRWIFGKCIQSARGAPLPCAVLDRSGQALPIDVSSYGIERFDVAKDDWRGKFHGWLNKAQEASAAAP